MRLPVIAIDPSLRNTGVALGHYQDDRLTITGLHLVETEKTKHKQTRKNSDDLACARLILDELRRHYREHEPVVTLVEVPSGTQSARASWSLGIMLGLIAALPHPVVELTAQQVKKGFTGNKTASKESMIETAVSQHPHLAWLRRGGRLLNKNEHLADAVAVAHVGVQSVAFRELLSVIKAARAA